MDAQESALKMRQYRKKSIQLRFSTVSAVLGAALLICLIYTMMPSSLLVMPHKPHATEFRRDDLPVSSRGTSMKN